VLVPVEFIMHTNLLNFFIRIIMSILEHESHFVKNLKTNKNNIKFKNK